MFRKLCAGTFGALGLTLVWMGMGRADDPATVQAMTRAMLGQQCVVCHGDIHKEWQNSLHAFAWRDPIFKAVRERVPDSATRCDHCHAPQPILMTGVGQIPKLRTGERDTGINCITCHMDADGVMHGPNGGTSPFHKTKTDPAFKGIDLCASCHGQPSVPEHDEITEFKKGYGKSGATCHVCHMPSEKRMAGVGGPMRDVGKHTWFGAFSEAQLKGAASVEAKVENGKVVVTITNSAGHPIPGAPYRSIIADVKAMDETNKQLLNEQQVFFKPLDPKQMEDKRIKPGAPRTLTYPITAQKGTVKVQLIYTRPNPAAPLDNTKVYRLVIAETEAKF